MKKRLSKRWIHRVLSDSLEGSCINMNPTKISFQMPTDPDQLDKLKNTGSIKVPLHYEKEAYELLCKFQREGIIERSPGESPFCARVFLYPSQAGKGSG